MSEAVNRCMGNHARRHVLGCVCLAIALFFVPRTGRAQQQAFEVPPTIMKVPYRQATVLGGVGNSLGWVGGQAERYLGGSRFSVFGGLGYTPQIPDLPDHPTGMTFALGGRAYTLGEKHRGFIETSVSQLAVGRVEGEGRRVYGPSVSLGYQYKASSGLTFMGSAGVGYAFAEEAEEDIGFGETLNIGLGYTWMREGDRDVDDVQSP